MDPKLIQRVQLLVKQVQLRRRKQRNGQIEQPRKHRLKEALTQRRGEIVLLR